MTWQPIETAPKDGTEVLICTCRHEIVVGAWSHDEQPHEWYIAAGTGSLVGQREPTHWMPLPNPPQT